MMDFFFFKQLTILATILVRKQQWNADFWQNFVGPSPSKWGIIRQDLSRIMAHALQTIQEKQLQILNLFLSSGSRGLLESSWAFIWRRQGDTLNNLPAHPRAMDNWNRTSYSCWAETRGQSRMAKVPVWTVHWGLKVWAPQVKMCIKLVRTFETFEINITWSFPEDNC